MHRLSDISFLLATASQYVDSIRNGLSLSEGGEECTGMLMCICHIRGYFDFRVSVCCITRTRNVTCKLLVSLLLTQTHWH